MAELQLVGDINELSEEQKKLIINVVEERGFKNAHIDIQPVGKADDNYVANVKRITVEKDGETFKMIAKIAPKGDMMRNFGNTNLIFVNEHIMYTQVLPKFTELEKAANIPEEERFRYATCYGTYVEAPNEMILLEDLAVSEFKILDKFSSLSDENVRLVLKNFAILHSLSYALRRQEPETFEMFSKSLVNLWLLMAELPDMVHWLTQNDADAQSLLDEDKHKKAVKNALVQMLALAPKLAKFDAGSKHSVIQQGDGWTNNIMFRFEVRMQ